MQPNKLSASAEYCEPGYVNFSLEGPGAHLFTDSDIVNGLEAGSYQARAAIWLETCFGEVGSPTRKQKRAWRFAEESIELAQAIGVKEEEFKDLVSYSFSRAMGEPHQEVGGVMLTLAGVCESNGLSLNECAEAELARVWTKVDAIRAKNARQAEGSPLPGSSEEKTDHIDKRTGRPIGDHGTAIQAIEYATEQYAVMGQEREFLKCWLEGNLDDWPEFYGWLKKKETGVV